MKNILAVDDNPANLTIVRECLKTDYKVTVVTSGEQALSFVSKRQPDLILLDHMMPGMDGIETMESLNQMEEHPWKVIFLTAVADADLFEECRKLGAVDCIAKPFVPAELKAAVEKVIGK